MGSLDGIPSIVVDNRIRVALGDISHEQHKALLAAFTHSNPDFHKYRAMRFRMKPPPKEIQTFDSETVGGGEVRRLTFPRGGLKRVSDILGPNVRLIDNRVVGKNGYRGEARGELRVTPWDTQLEMVAAACREESCVIRSAAGSGKTTAALALFHHLNLPTLIVVNTEGLLKQWVDECVTKLGLRTDQIGIIRGSTRGIRQITIGMQATLRNCAHEYAKHFGLVVLDEAQYAAAKTFTEVIDHFHSRYRVAFSADERRADRKEFLTYDLFGPIALKVETKKLVEAGRLLPVEVVVVPTEFRAPWYSELRARAADRSVTEKARANSRKAMALGMNELLGQLADDDDRAHSISRIASLEVSDGHTVVALTHRREHASQIASVFQRITDGRAGLLLGGAETSAEYDEAKRGMKAGEVVAAAATYQAFGTGIDVPRLDVGIFATPCANAAKGRMQFNQYTGRFARAAGPGKKPIVYYLWDRHVFGTTPLKNIAAWAKSASIVIDGERVPLKRYLKDRRHPSFHETTQRRDRPERSSDGSTGRTESRASAVEAPPRPLRKRSEAGGTDRG
jgi:superfamily II DNA or RNA helicase